MSEVSTSGIYSQHLAQLNVVLLVYLIDWRSIYLFGCFHKTNFKIGVNLVTTGTITAVAVVLGLERLLM